MILRKSLREFFEVSVPHYRGLISRDPVDAKDTLLVNLQKCHERHDGNQKPVSAPFKPVTLNRRFGTFRYTDLQVSPPTVAPGCFTKVSCELEENYLPKFA